MLSLYLVLMLNAHSAVKPAPQVDVKTRDADGRTALHSALTPGQAKVLLDAGADIEAKDLYGETPLHWAAMNGWSQELDYLLSRGASVNARDDQGLTPLHWAVRRGSMDAAKSLIASGAEVNARSLNGLSPLHLAAAQDDRLVVEFLLAKGALVGAADSLAQTPIFHAAAAGERGTLAALLAKGANINARDKVGNTPLTLAILSGRKHLARYMVSVGADPHMKNNVGKLPVDFPKDASPEALTAFLATKEPPTAEFKQVWKVPLSEYFFPSSTCSAGTWLAVCDAHVYVAGLDLDLASGKQFRKLWKDAEGLVLDEILLSKDQVLLLANYPSNEEPGPNEFGRRKRIQNDRILIALDGRTGKRRWRIKGQIPLGLAAAQSRVFLVRDDVLQAVDSASGKVQWRVPAVGIHQDEPLVASDRVVITQSSGEDELNNLVQAYSIKNGKHLWTTSLAGDTCAAPTTGNGCFFVGREATIAAENPEEAATQNFTIWALDETTGKPRWHREFKGQSSSTPLTFSNGCLFVVTNKSIHALSADTGELRWSQELGNENVNHDSTPVMAGDLVLLWSESLEELEKSSVSHSYSLLALDVTTGAIRWSYPFAADHDLDTSPTLSRPFFKDGTLVFSDESSVFRLQQSKVR